MKKVNQKLKTLLSKEINRDYFKISTTLLVYLLIISIFYAGFEYKKYSDIGSEKNEKFMQYKYYVRINNGKETIYTSREQESLFSIINDIEGIEVEYLEYFEGKEILTLNKSKNFEILLNDIKIDGKFYPANSQFIEDRTDIDILIYYD
jgi:hypothetical protein